MSRRRLPISDSERKHRHDFASFQSLRRARGEGRCAECRRKKRGEDLAHWCCRRCRKIRADKQRARYYRAVATARRLGTLPKFGALSPRERRLVEYVRLVTTRELVKSNGGRE